MTNYSALVYLSTACKAMKIIQVTLDLLWDKERRMWLNPVNIFFNQISIKSPPHPPTPDAHKENNHNIEIELVVKLPFVL